jgi:hypothetical protein
MSNILFLHTTGVPIVKETFIGLGSEWWSVIVTLFTGLSAFFVAWAVFLYAKSNERRLTKCYKMRIARLLYQLHSYLLVCVDSDDLNDIESFFSENGIGSISKKLNEICDKLDNYIDHIIDKLDYKRLDGIEKTFEWIREITSDIQYRKSLYLTLYGETNKQLIDDLKTHKQAVVKFLKYLKVKDYIDNDLFSDLETKERPAGSTCPAGQQGEEQ